jgi:hypothetical protein
MSLSLTLRFYWYWSLWLLLLYIIQMLYRQDDLERLIQWSKRKRLAAPHAFYSHLLSDTELALANARIRHPFLTTIASFLYELGTVLFPSSAYYRRGSAAKYRLRNL